MDVRRRARLERDHLRRVLTGGKQVKRYFIERPDLWLIYTSDSDDFSALPNIRRYIDKFRSKITCKEVKHKKHSRYALHRPPEGTHLYEAQQNRWSHH